MTKTDLFKIFEERFPESDALLHYMFDYFDSRHLKGLLDHINDENNEEDEDDIDDDEDGPGDIGWNNGEFYK